MCTLAHTRNVTVFNYEIVLMAARVLRFKVGTHKPHGVIPSK